MTRLDHSEFPGGRVDPGPPGVRLEHGVGDELGVQAVVEAGHGRPRSTIAEMNSHIRS